MMIEINAVTGLEEHEIGNSRQDGDVFFYCAPRDLLSLFPIGDIDGDAAQADDFSSAVSDVDQIVLGPNNATIFRQPTKLRERMVSAGEDLVAFPQDPLAIILMQDSGAEAGGLGQPLLSRISQHLLHVVADKGGRSFMSNRVSKRFPNDAGNVRDDFVETAVGLFSDGGQTLTLALCCSLAPQRNYQEGD